MNCRTCGHFPCRCAPLDLLPPPPEYVEMRTRPAYVKEILDGMNLLLQSHAALGKQLEQVLTEQDEQFVQAGVHFQDLATALRQIDAKLDTVTDRFEEFPSRQEIGDLWLRLETKLDAGLRGVSDGCGVAIAELRKDLVARLMAIEDLVAFTVNIETGPAYEVKRRKPSKKPAARRSERS